MAVGLLVVACTFVFTGDQLGHVGSIGAIAGLVFNTGAFAVGPGVLAADQRAIPGQGPR